MATLDDVQTREYCAKRRGSGSRSVHKKIWLLSATHENSIHLSIAAVLFSKVTAVSSLLIGKGSFRLSLVVGCVVDVSQSPLLLVAVVFAMICDLFSYSSFLRDVRISD